MHCSYNLQKVKTNLNAWIGSKELTVTLWEDINLVLGFRAFRQVVHSNRVTKKYLKPPSDSSFVWILQQSNFVVVIDRIRTLEQIGSDDLLSSAWAVDGFDHKLWFLASVQQKCQWFCIRVSIGIVNNWDGEKHDKKIQDVDFWRLDVPRPNDPVLQGLKGLPQQEQQVPKQGGALAVKDPLQHLQAREEHKGIYCRINYQHFAWGLLLQWGVEGEERTINAAYWGAHVRPLTGLTTPKCFTSPLQLLSNLLKHPSFHASTVYLLPSRKVRHGWYKLDTSWTEQKKNSYGHLSRPQAWQRFNKMLVLPDWHYPAEKTFVNGGQGASGVISHGSSTSAVSSRQRRVTCQVDRHLIRPATQRAP